MGFWDRLDLGMRRVKTPQPCLGAGCLVGMVMPSLRGASREKQIWGRKVGSTSDVFAQRDLCNIQRGI